MKIIKSIFSLALLAMIIGMGFMVIRTARETQHLKKDYAEINHFKYGLFSVDTWKTQLHEILADEIDSFQLRPENERVIQKQLERQLSVLIDKMIARIEKENTKTAKGFFKQGFLDTFIDVREIKKGVPEYARAIMKEMKSSKSLSQLKTIIKRKVQDYVKKSYDVRQADLKAKIIARYSAQAKEAEARAKIESRIVKNQQTIREYSLYLILLAVIVFIVEGLNKGPVPQLQFFALAGTLLVLLTVGVATPMIDMEAKISSLSFVLLDHPVTFQNQVLFFQSKSIMDVFWIMIKHPELEMKLVGILMVCFSVVFPVCKMLSSVGYYYNYCEARRRKLIQFFVLKSGKWSMADVLVVAIFMAYIGFNGIINSQLVDLKEATESVDIMTTNGTNLQPGYYIFLSYTILAMFLSGYIKKRPYQCIMAAEKEENPEPDQSVTAH